MKAKREQNEEQPKIIKLFSINYAKEIYKITLSSTKTKLVNKLHSILDKYDYQTDLTRYI